MAFQVAYLVATVETPESGFADWAKFLSASASAHDVCFVCLHGKTKDTIGGL